MTAKGRRLLQQVTLGQCKVDLAIWLMLYHFLDLYVGGSQNTAQPA